jgi:hypothetical protein
MRMDELVKGLNFLGLAYGKEYNQMEAQQVYEFVKEYTYEVFIKAVKEIIRTSKFLPRIADLIEACEKYKGSERKEVIDYMRSVGYFKYSAYGEVTEEKASRNYSKALRFIEIGVIPDWLQEDIDYYVNQMHQLRLEAENNKLLS